MKLFCWYSGIFGFTVFAIPDGFPSCANFFPPVCGFRAYFGRNSGFGDITSLYFHIRIILVTTIPILT